MVMSEETRATLREAFNFIDLDKSGYINFDELKRFIELTGEIVDTSLLNIDYTKLN